MKPIFVVLIALAFMGPAFVAHASSQPHPIASNSQGHLSLNGNITQVNSTSNRTSSNATFPFNPTTVYAYVIANSTDVLGFQAYAGYKDDGNVTMPVDMIAIIHSPGPSELTIKENGTVIVSDLKFSNLTSWSFTSPYLNSQGISIQITNHQGNFTALKTISVNILTTTSFIDYEWYQHSRPTTNPWNLTAYLSLAMVLTLMAVATYLIFFYWKGNHWKKKSIDQDYETGSTFWNR